MAEVEVQITNRLGLHARAAGRFVHLASRFQAEVLVVKGGSRVNGKSILGLLTLAASKGTHLRVAAEGEDAAEAVEQLAELVRTRFGEDD